MATGTLALILFLGTTPGAGDVWHIKERSLRIPIKVDPARRNQIKELRSSRPRTRGRLGSRWAWRTRMTTAFLSVRQRTENTGLPLWWWTCREGRSQRTFIKSPRAKK